MYLLRDLYKTGYCQHLLLVTWKKASLRLVPVANQKGRGAYYASQKVVQKHCNAFILSHGDEEEFDSTVQ